MSNETKLTPLGILLSPFSVLAKMAKSGPDVDTELGLDVNSSDKTEAVLAESLENVDKKVENFGNSGKSQKRSEVIKAVKVEQKELKQKEESQKEEKTQKQKDVKEQNNQLER